MDARRSDRASCAPVEANAHSNELLGWNEPIEAIETRRILVTRLNDVCIILVVGDEPRGRAPAWPSAPDYNLAVAGSGEDTPLPRRRGSSRV